MYGDTDVLRRRVTQLREQAVDVRTLADQLVARTEVVTWTGRAADSMRRRVTERAGALRAAAAEHERAADSLAQHLREVDRLREAVDATEQKAARLVAEARSRRAHQRQTEVALSPEPADEVLLAFDPPPPGHADWLAVELPGL